MKKEILEKLITRCERYFYKYLLTQDKDYIEKLFKTTKQLKRALKKWKTQ